VVCKNPLLYEVRCSSNKKDYVSQFISSVIPFVAPSNADKYSPLPRSEVTLRLTVSQYVLASSPPWDLRLDINSVWISLCCLCWAPSLTRGRVCLFSVRVGFVTFIINTPLKSSQSYFTADSMFWCQAHSGIYDQILLPVWRFLRESCCLVSMGLPLWREDGSTVCCAVNGPSREEPVTILNCLIWDSANLESQAPVFISPRNRMAQLYPRPLGFLYVAFYDSQGYGGDILTRLHMGDGDNEVEVTLRLTVGRYVFVSSPLWDLRPDITSCRNVAVWKLRSCFCGAPSLTRGRVCNLHCNNSMVRVAQNP
jgi:hypothetical protein